MNRSEILEKTEKVEFADIEPYLHLFISSCVDKQRRDRWKFFSKSIDDLSLKFNSLWNGISSNKATILSNVNLTASSYIYINLEDGGKHGYLLSKADAQEIGDAPHDGVLFAKDKKQAIFLTHESEFYHFRLNNG